MNKKEIEAMPINDKLIELIAPQGLKFKRDIVETGEKISRIYFISSYPEKPPLGWIASLGTIKNTVLSIIVNPVNPQQFIDGLKKGTNSDKNIYNTTRDEVERIRAEARINSSIKIIQDIENNNNAYVYISVVAMVSGNNEIELENNCKIFKNRAAGLGLRVRSCAFMMDKAYRQVAPFGMYDDEIFRISKQNMQVGSLMAGEPFSGSGFADKTGYYLGSDESGRMIALDPFKKDGDRTNSNFAIVGTSGSGKSYATKKIILNEYISGTKIMIIDPENEYKDMCNKIEDSRWIDCSGGIGKVGRINPLQVYNLATIDIEDEDNKKSPLALHFQNLGTFFSLYFKDQLSVRITAILNEALEELYKNFGIEWDTDTSLLKNEQFPIMKDLYDLLMLKRESTTDERRKTDYEDLSSIIRELAIGADSQMFNGYTTIEADSKFIVLDTSNMEGSKTNVKSCQYFNMLRFCQNEAFKDRNERFMVVADEAYLLLDPKVPQATEFLRNFSKRARKYECGLMVITQSIIDFLAENIKQYGQALFDNATYRLYFGMDGKNLQQAKELWEFTVEETNLLSNKIRGQCLLWLGSSRLLCRIKGQPWEQPFLTGGGK